MIAAAEVVAVAGEPLVEAIGDAAHEGDLEHPGNETTLRQHVEELLDRTRARRGTSAGADELHRLDIGARRNPRETRHHARLLRGHDLDLGIAVPRAQ